jgi:hypothetical protein
MKKIALILIVLITASCQSYDHGHGLSGLAGLGSGALAWNLTEGKSSGERLALTGAAALGAFAFGEYVRSQVIASEQKQYALGYQMGQADASKRQYEIIQNRQREDSPARKRRFITYEFPGVPERQGVNFAPHTVKLRVEE